LPDSSGLPVRTRSIDCPSTFFISSNEWNDIIRALRITGARYLACDKTGHVLAAAGRVLIAALAFHAHFADRNQFIHFLKNFAMVSGLLQVPTFGSGRVGLDRR